MQPQAQVPRGLSDYPIGRSLWDITARLQDNFRRVEAILTRLENEGEDSTVQLAAAAEIRQHIALAHKALESAAKLESVRNFESSIFSALDQAGVEVRRKVMDILNARAETEQPEQPPDPE